MTQDLVGEKFGRLTVLSKTDKRYHTLVVWMCVCDCGANVSVPSHWLTAGLKKSCGCYRADRASGLGATFGPKSARLLTAPGVKQKHLKAAGTNRAKSLLARLDAGLLLFVLLLSCGVVEAKQVVIEYNDFLQMLAKTEHRDKLLNQCKAGEVVRVQIDKENDHKIELLEGQIKNLIETAETQERLGKTQEQINEALQKQLSKLASDLDKEKRLSRYKSETVWLGVAGAIFLWVVN